MRKNIGGGVTKFSPNGTALSPPITGFTGMGIDGVGWGTAVALDKVWITSFNGKILVMDFDGYPIGDESDFPFKERLTGLMGVGIATNAELIGLNLTRYVLPALSQEPTLDGCPQAHA